MKNKLFLILLGIIALYCLSLIRYRTSPKVFSTDHQYSFYAKEGLFGFRFLTAPGDGSTTSGTIYVYDEVNSEVIYQFDSERIKTDLEASAFSNVDGGLFICKSGHTVKLPRPID